ncbi:fibulin-2-like [Rhopilema esculentum]|uniref:fibulin-2-like n=1 Tax=Rhopilema esculentum TaxID=499914 RepID=UPI0031E43C8F
MSQWQSDFASYKTARFLQGKNNMKFYSIFYVHLFAIFLHKANGVCYSSTKYATTSLQTLSRTYYSNNELCTTYIRPSSSYPSSSYYLEIKWTRLSVQGSLPSCTDYVEVFLTRLYKSIGRYCSDNMIDTKPFNMYSYDGYANIVFRSDSSITRTGFSLTYQLKSKSSSRMGGSATSSCYYSDSSAAATFYSSGWPYSYYASSTPCWRRYYAGNNPVRVAVMDVSLYRTSSVYCYTTDSYFEVKASSTVYTTSSSITSYATTVSGRICGIKTPTVYTAKNKYVYLLLNRPHTFSGYRGVIVGYMAYDINECTTRTHRCSSNAICTNTVGSYKCTCKSGYTGTGTSCADLNECRRGTHRCSSNALCTNTIGSYRCYCKSGYIGTGFSCLDVNECTKGTHRCSSNALCSNTAGSYRCFCKSGYTGSGTSCSVLNECTQGTHRCSSNAICIKTTTSYRCSCKSGYTGTGISCADLNECTRGTHRCSSNALCTNTIGADYERGVLVLNECTQGTHRCSSNAICIKTTTSYRCSCKSGYTGTGISCADLNECTRGTHRCSSNALCTNTIGSYRCYCKSGYIGTGFSCLDVNECTKGTHRCSSNALCSNTAGSYRCFCKSGYTGSGTSCSVLNECTQGTHRCSSNAICIKTTTSYRCSCKSGYTGTGISCADVNECTKRTHGCNSNALCTNTAGSYRCTCNSGYTGSGTTCSIVDANECSQGTHRCSANALCINTVGSYRCACKSGYKGTGSSCEAADDVASSKTVASKDSSSSTDLGKAIGGSMAGLVLVLGIIAELVHLRRKGSRNSEQNQASLRTQGDEPGARYNAASNNHDDGQVEIQSDPSNSVKYKTKCDSPARQQKV